MDNHDVITAVQYGDFRTLREYIEHRIYSPNAKDIDGCSLLHWAAINNRVQMTQYLIEHGACIDYQGGYLMETPLHWAVRKNFYRVVKLLIDHGANLRIKSNVGVDIIHLACQLGNLDTIFLLLSLEKQQQPNSDLSSALLMSLVDSQTGNGSHNDIVNPIRLLFRLSKANFFQTSPDTGNNILHLLSSKSSSEVSADVIWTIWSREEAKLAKDVKNREGKTPYQVAQQRRDVFMFRFIWDLWMYNTFPRPTPAISKFIACLIPSLSFPLCGWLYGSILTLCGWLLADCLGQNTLPPQASRTSQGIAWGLLAVVTYEFWTHLQPELTSGSSWSSFSSSVFCLCFYSLAALSAFLMLRISYTRAKRAEPTERKELIAKIIATAPREGPDHPPITEIALCASCVLDKQHVSVHCSTCDACMSPLLDHHCAFVNNCIGEGNRRLFCSFLLATLSATALALYATLTTSLIHCPVTLRLNLVEVASGYHSCLLKREILHFEALLSLNCALFLWLFALLYGQLLSVACETTVFEITKRRNVSQWFSLNRMAANLNLFLLTGYYQVTRSEDTASISSGLSSSSPAAAPTGGLHGFQRSVSVSSGRGRGGGTGTGTAQEEMENLLFESNASTSSIHGSGHGLGHGPSPVARYREGSFDIEMNHTATPGHSHGPHSNSSHGGYSYGHERDGGGSSSYR